MRSSTSTGILAAYAECEEPGCPWGRKEGRNVLGMAARHADAHPSHVIRCEQVNSVIYNLLPGSSNARTSLPASSMPEPAP